MIYIEEAEKENVSEKQTSPSSTMSTTAAAAAKPPSWPEQLARIKARNAPSRASDSVDSTESVVPPRKRLKDDKVASDQNANKSASSSSISNNSRYEKHTGLKAVVNEYSTTAY